MTNASTLLRPFRRALFWSRSNTEISHVNPPNRPSVAPVRSARASGQIPKRRSAIGALVLGLGSCALSPGLAVADPCKAIPDDPKAPMPAYIQLGAPFSGPVAYVGDGDSLCVQVRPGALGLVEVRVADFLAPEIHEPGGAEAKAALTSIAMGMAAVCVPERGFDGKIRSRDRVIARCRISGVSIGDLMRRAGVREGGRGAR